MKTQKQDKYERLNSSVGFQYAREAMNRPCKRQFENNEVEDIHNFVKDALRRNVLGLKRRKQ